MRWIMRASRGFLTPAAGGSVDAGASGFESVVGLAAGGFGGSVEDDGGGLSSGSAVLPFVSAMVEASSGGEEEEGGGCVEEEGGSRSRCRGPRCCGRDSRCAVCSIRAGGKSRIHSAVFCAGPACIWSPIPRVLENKSLTLAAYLFPTSPTRLPFDYSTSPSPHSSPHSSPSPPLTHSHAPSASLGPSLPPIHPQRPPRPPPRFSALLLPLPPPPPPQWQSP